MFDETDINTNIQLIGNLGFPIVISIILLRTLLGSFNKRLDSLDKRLTQLNKTMILLTKSLSFDNTKNDDSITQDKED